MSKISRRKNLQSYIKSLINLRQTSSEFFFEMESVNVLIYSSQFQKIVQIFGVIEKLSFQHEKLWRRNI